MTTEQETLEQKLQLELDGPTLFNELSGKTALCETCGVEVYVLVGCVHGGDKEALWMSGANWSFHCTDCTPKIDSISVVLHVRLDRLLGPEGRDLGEWLETFRRLGPEFRPEWLGALLMNLCGRGEGLCRLLEQRWFQEELEITTRSCIEDPDAEGDAAHEGRYWDEKLGRWLRAYEFVGEFSKSLATKTAPCEQCGRDTPVKEGYFYGGLDRVSWLPGGDWSFLCPECQPLEEHRSTLLRIRGSKLLGSQGEGLNLWFRCLSTLGEAYNGANLTGLLCNILGADIQRWVRSAREDGEARYDA
jgi:hypothetical protein